MLYSMILDRADQAITVTDVQRRTKVLFDKLQNGEQDRYVVMRDGKPIFIMIRLVELAGRPLLERADQAITATEVQRNAKEIFDKLQNGEQDRYVVMREGKPAVELLPLETYEALMEDLGMQQP
jgi:PHD/YefM family antitoxin component YafN of YafNO toxin-antitoxin module